MHATLSLCRVQLIRSCQEAVLERSRVNLQEHATTHFSVCVVIEHALQTRAHGTTCKSDSILSRLFMSWRSTSSPLRSRAISCNRPATVRCSTTSLLMMCVRKSSMPISLFKGAGHSVTEGTSKYSSNNDLPERGDAGVLQDVSSVEVEEDAANHDLCGHRQQSAEHVLMQESSAQIFVLLTICLQCACQH